MRRSPQRLARTTARSGAALATTLGALGAFAIDHRRQPASREHALMHLWLSRWARATLRVLGVRLCGEGRGLPPAPPYPARGPAGVGRVFVMNHRSAVDIPLMLALAQVHLVSRNDLGAWPLIGASARLIGTLFVDRRSPRSGAAVLRAMTTRLKTGCGVGIFPEGTAFAGDEVRPFLPGAFSAARRAGAEIVPMGVAYADPAAHFGDEGFGSHLARVTALRSLAVAAVVGAPISGAGVARAALRESVREQVQRLVHRARALLG